MPFIKVTNIILEEEYKELKEAYNSDPKIKRAINLFNAECENRAKLKAKENEYDLKIFDEIYEETQNDNWYTQNDVEIELNI